MAAPTPSSKPAWRPLLMFLVGAFLIAMGYVMTHRPAPSAVPDLAAIQTPAAVDSSAPQAPEASPPETVSLIPSDASAAPAAPQPSVPAAQPHGNTIGDPKAPIKIVEYSSLTCGHCGHFHKDTFEALRAKYIDTGKVFMEFREMPLNKPALDATLVLKCLPEDRYFSFMTLLFQTQEHWAFTQDYLTPLRQNAKLAGLSDSEIDSCLANKLTQAALIARIKEAGEKYGVDSTPTFIFNDGADKLVGAQPIEAFSKVIDALLAAPAPAEKK